MQQTKSQKWIQRAASLPPGPAAACMAAFSAASCSILASRSLSAFSCSFSMKYSCCASGRCSNRWHILSSLAMTFSLSLSSICFTLAMKLSLKIWISLVMPFRCVALHYRNFSVCAWIFWFAFLISGLWLCISLRTPWLRVALIKP